MASLLLLTSVLSAVFLLNADVADAKAYKIQERKVNWFEAFQDCRLKNWQLATVRNQREQENMEKELNGLDSAKNEGHVWIVATDLAKNGDLRWFSTGERIEYSSKAGQFSDNAPACMALQNEGGQWKWNKYTCDKEHFYACETP